MGRVVLNSGSVNGLANQMLLKTVDVSQLPSGFYLMNFQTQEGATGLPFLKLRARKVLIQSEIIC